MTGIEISIITLLNFMYGAGVNVLEAWQAKLSRYTPWRSLGDRRYIVPTHS
jgi:hypothetical protein